MHFNIAYFWLNYLHIPYQFVDFCFIWLSISDTFSKNTIWKKAIYSTMFFLIIIFYISPLSLLVSLVALENLLSKQSPEFWFFHSFFYNEYSL